MLLWRVLGRCILIWRIEAVFVLDTCRWIQGRADKKPNDSIVLTLMLLLSRRQGHHKRYWRSISCSVIYAPANANFTAYLSSHPRHPLAPA
jgi:hypothetical protein